MIVAENKQKRDIFSKNLTKLRQDAGLSQHQLADTMNIMNQNQKPLVRTQTVSSWEHGHIPNPARLDLLARIFGVSIDFLTGAINSNNTMPLSSFNLYDKCTRIEQKDLIQFSYEPLFFIPYHPNTTDTDDLNGTWGILSQDSRHFITLNSKIPTQTMRGNFYTLRPLPSTKVIGLEEAKTKQKIFVIPEGIDRKLAITLRGWYFYDHDKNIFIKTDHAYCFPEDQYGSRYLGYADVPDVI
ncbi:helix-turn-helix domain-containing protein [Bilifractor sp. LCP19S3_H10]|uniref:helix-turn-helix domain-containing protein n=1 Tax=Bilifractor sp. LCP19S3_H10 TaxID=3438736 RepID=UPI003F8DCD68